MYVDRRYDLERACNNQIGELRVMFKDGEWWFCATDICNAINEASEIKQETQPKTKIEKLQLELEEIKKRVTSLEKLHQHLVDFCKHYNRD